ncbi:MAG: hypothetical protein K1X79_07325 [Oligoflexia bacterium]|nr:hypothetical protein [Oligoflexia bacterium]
MKYRVRRAVKCLSDLTRSRDWFSIASYICLPNFASLVPPLCIMTALASSLPVLAEDKANQAQSETRQIPGQDARPTKFPPFVYESIPNYETSASDFVSVPDRWRQFYKGKFYDPYNQNVLKGDIPVFGAPGHEWFFESTIISDTLLERRALPLPVGGPSTNSSESTDTFGERRQGIINENLLTSFSLYKGATSFKPPEFEFRLTPVFNYNYVDIEETGVLRVNPEYGNTRDDNHMGLQDAFVDIHLADLSERYDFLSLRAGIQNFISDFRGFVFSDSAPGVRLFGNYENNIWQYNLAWFSRLDKDTNSGLNTFDSRHEQVFLANIYHQDLPIPGHGISFSVLHRRDSAGDFADDYDNNGFLVRPAPIGDERAKNISTTYIGLSSDGHIGRINSTAAFYYVTGSESHNPIAGQEVDINAAMLAMELSYDIDWIRLRASFFWASGDHDPFDGRATGFDSIVDNPNFAGGDLSFWQRLGIPLIGGGGVNLVNAGSLLPDLRPGKEEGQSNFVNPGLRLYNLGVDFELTPKLKLINNASFLQFDNVSVLRAVRQDGSFDRSIGFDFSSGLLYRPFLNNNVQVRVGASALVTDKGFENLFGDRVLFDVFSNLILQY